uniref:Uncharacterized protein n=1 Tax=Parascaris equorum TaxID=6256 RepID=A0A914R8H9_PAREQ
MATLIQATQPTDDTAALIPQQSQSVSTPPKPPVSFYARGFKGAHASFRLRMFQEQHGFEPVSLDEFAIKVYLISTTAPIYDTYIFIL